MDPKAIGKKLKTTWTGATSSDGRKYAEIPDEELGSMYIKKWGGSIEAVKSGQLKMTDIPEKNRVYVGVGLSALAGDTPMGIDAVSEAVKQGGSQLINKAKTKDERIAIAEEILKSGGVDKYRQILPLTDLATEAEQTGLTASTDQ
jgi:hypothetical protein